MCASSGSGADLPESDERRAVPDLNPGHSGPGPLVDAIEASGLVDPDSTGVLLLSGGADSCALAFGLAGLEPRPQFCALHLNYALRRESGKDEAACVSLCERLGIELLVERPVRPAGPGNLHAWAREERYRAAEAVRSERGFDWIALAHTAGDLAETVIYRLAVSPGTRALAAMPARRGPVIRPLLRLSREQVRREAQAAGLPFVDDRSNDDPSFARARIRSEVLPVLAELNPSVLEVISRTRDDLAEELDFLGRAGAELIEEGPGEVPRITSSRLEEAHPAVCRFALRSMAEAALDRSVPVSREQTAEICRLVAEPEGGSIDIGEGASLVAESGTVMVEPGRVGARSDRAQLELPGRLEWGRWTILAEVMEAPFEAEGPGVATLDADQLDATVEVRSWLEGDRIEPLGMDGSKSLQDLFTDGRLPRSERRRLPLLVSGGEVAWVPGLAIGERFRLTPQTKRAIRFEATSPRGPRGLSPGD